MDGEPRSLFQQMHTMFQSCFGKRTLMEMKGSNSQVFRNKLLSDLSVPPPDSQHKFLGKRNSAKHEPHKSAQEGKKRNKVFHQRERLGLLPSGL